MTLRVVFVTFLLISLVVVGCSSKVVGGPRLKTTPLSATVHVDGEPAAGLIVTALPDAGSSSAKRPVITITDAKGKFSAGTYQAGDGLPEGTYTLVFRWPTIGESRKDKLNGSYAEPKESKHKVTIVDGKSNDLGVIDLYTEGSEK